MIGRKRERKSQGNLCCWHNLMIIRIGFLYLFMNPFALNEHPAYNVFDVFVCYLLSLLFS